MIKTRKENEINMLNSNLMLLIKDNESTVTSNAKNEKSKNMRGYFIYKLVCGELLVTTVLFLVKNVIGLIR